MAEQSSYSDMQFQKLIEDKAKLEGEVGRLDRALDLAVEECKLLADARGALVAALHRDGRLSEYCECERWRGGVTLCPVHLDRKPE